MTTSVIDYPVLVEETPSVSTRRVVLNALVPMVTSSALLEGIALVRISFKIENFHV